MAQCVDIIFTTWCDLVTNKVQCDKEEIIKRHACAMCKIDPLEEPISRDNRTLYYFIQCSVTAESAGEHHKRTYLHPECFARYHRHMYDKVVRSSKVKSIATAESWAPSVAPSTSST